MSQKWSVKSLVAYLKLKLDNDFLIQNINVVGEISNFNYHNNKHMYFTLKDESSRISCVMFATQARTVKFMPKDGMKVNLVASVSIFEASGSLQLYVSQMSEEGVGDLAARFEALKKKLAEEGLFNDNHKKTFVKYPKRIAVVSGKDSAALNDILTTLNRRWPIAEVDVYPSLVQGPTAHLDLIENLNNIDHLNYDAIILARGGGSIEDLWAFNEEALARTIYNLKTPIISGVGHEIDFTISDFVSDLRAPTPTAAAELITPDIKDVKQIVNHQQKLLKERMTQILNNNNQLVYTYASKPIFMHPELLTTQYSKDLKNLEERLLIFKDKSIKMVHNYNQLSNEFIKSVNKVMSEEKIKLNTLDNQIHNNIKTYKNKVDHHFATQLGLLNSYSPINTLKRGYSIVELDDQVIVSSDDVQIGELIKIKMSDGTIKANVIQKEKHNGEL